MRQPPEQGPGARRAATASERGSGAQNGRVGGQNGRVDPSRIPGRSRLAQLSDVELRELIDRPEALRELIDRLGSRAYATALRRVRDPSTAEEVVRASFLAVRRSAVLQDVGRAGAQNGHVRAQSGHSQNGHARLQNGRVDSSRIPGRSRLAQLSDAELRELIDRPEALRELIDRLGSRAYARVLRMVRDPSTAEEIVHASFLAVRRSAVLQDVGLGSARGELTSLVHRRPFEFARTKPHGQGTSNVGGLASVSALTRAQRAAHLGLGLLWVLLNVQFWTWWVSHTQSGEPWLAVPVSAALAYQVSVLPTVFWWFLGRMRRPVHRRPPNTLRVAMITLCVPSFESLEVVESQLRALSAVRYPHDSWILDEENSPLVRELAGRYGVRYFSRKGIERWNQPGPPYQRKTKAGNVNAWLASLAEEGIDYDVFVQLDIDHRPDCSYLDRVLGHFDDPNLGWVQAPSVCGNLDSWTARGLAEQELVLQGPLQMGFYGSSRTPFIIGSHTSYRTSAILEIGGFQPTRAEDHLDTVLLAAHGYRGVYVPEIIAAGDGPEDFVTYLRQQFAWAHSMITVLFSWTPRLLRRYTLRQALQFLFSQTWYLLWSVSMLVLWVAPLVALLTDRRIAATTLSEYLVYFTPLPLAGWLMWFFARPWFKPHGVRISWRGVVLTVARWPVVLWALLSVLMRIKRPYMITPKGVSVAGMRPAIVALAPLFAFVAIALGGVWLSGALVHAGYGRSYVLLVLINALIMVLVSDTVLLLEMSRRPATDRTLRGLVAGRVGAFGWLVVLVGALATTTVVFWDSVQAAIS